MNILNKPKCINYERCENEAMSLVNGMWLCGECIVKLQNRIKKAKEKIMLEEGF